MTLESFYYPDVDVAIDSFTAPVAVDPSGLDVDIDPITPTRSIDSSGIRVEIDQNGRTTNIDQIVDSTKRSVDQIERNVEAHQAYLQGQLVALQSVLETMQTDKDSLSLLAESDLGTRNSLLSLKTALDGHSTAFRNVERILESHKDVLSVEPPPSSLLCLPLYLNGGLAGAVSPGLTLRSECSPVYATASVDQGDVTMQIQRHDGSSWNDLFGTDLDTSSATPYYESDENFEVGVIDKGDQLRVKIVAIGSGAPTEMHAWLWCNEVQQVNP